MALTFQDRLVVHFLVLPALSTMFSVRGSGTARADLRGYSNFEPGVIAVKFTSLPFDLRVVGAESRYRPASRKFRAWRVFFRTDKASFGQAIFVDHVRQVFRRPVAS